MTAAPRRRTSCVAVAALAILLSGTPAPGEDRHDAPSRSDEGPSVPLALAWGPGGRLYVAEREARRLSVVDPATWRVVARRPLGFRPASLAASDDGATLLVGGMAGELARVGADGRIAWRLQAGRGPARVRTLPGTRAVVSCRWDPCVRVVDTRIGRVVAEHPVSFAPGALVVRPDGRVIVADAFRGRIADLTPDRVGSVREREISGVNLHALAISGDGRELLIGHSAQPTDRPLTRSNIDWGVVHSTKLTAVRLTEFDRGGPDTPLHARRLTLDGSGHGAADPSALAVSADGTRVVVALAGAHQVLAIDRGLGARTEPDLPPLGDSQRIEAREVGRGPADVVLDPAGRHVLTADAMSDTLTVLEFPTLAPVATLRLGPEAPIRSAAQRGEAAFHDGRAALDRWMSCASCHPHGHTNGLNYDTQGDGDYGAPKNVPGLLGVVDTAPYAWTGRFRRLEDQVHQSLLTSLHGPGPEPDQVADLVAYLGALEPPPPRRSPTDPAARRGAEQFRDAGCVACHRPPSYTSRPIHPIILDGEPTRARWRFNAPSLRGVAWSAPYFHDGRAATLSEALELHHPGSGRPPSVEQIADLVAFLESL